MSEQLKSKLKSFSLLSVAKFNPFLQVGSQREDGRHNLFLGFQFIDLADEVHFQLTKKEITFDYQLPFKRKNDLCYQAVNLLKQTKAYQIRKNKALLDVGVKIILTKKIPFGSGLGGGSSNAATTLIALNLLWDLKLNKNELCQLGSKIGADVPIFIYGRAAKARGIGDQFSNYHFVEKKYLLLYPGVLVATSQVFNHPNLIKRSKFTDWKSETDYQNDFEKTTFCLYPEVSNAHKFLSKFGRVSMSGTGSSLFLDANHLEKNEITDLEQKIRKSSSYQENWLLYSVKSLNISPLDIELSVFN